MAKRGPKLKPPKYYMVYLRKTDEIVAFGTDRACARQLGMTLCSFREAASRTRHGIKGRYEFTEDETPYDEEWEDIMARKRLIDANALTDLEALEHTMHDGEQWYKVADVWDCIDSTPTEDAAAVVRCKDCKWFYAVGKTPSFCRNTQGMVGVNALDFCSRGKRSDDDE